MTLRLASYNVHKCLGLDRRRRPDRVLAVMAALRADVLALQEVDHRLGPRPAALSRELVERATALVALPFALNHQSLGWHGQVILIRPDFQLLGLRRIELPGLEPRGALIAEMETPAGPFRAVGLHLALMRRFRRMQLAAIRAALSLRAEMPTVLLGDFNEWSPRGGAEPLSGHFRLHAPGPSFPAARPVARLDRIALGQGVHLDRAGVYDDHQAPVASDHLPVWAEVRI